jgi:hypothetical protein
MIVIDSQFKLALFAMGWFLFGLLFGALVW